jgi:hypothetical protein
MADVTYRLPDGSIKSFPDSMSDEEIKGFVGKKFPTPETAYWLAGPLSRHIEQELDTRVAMGSVLGEPEPKEKRHIIENKFEDKKTIGRAIERFLNGEPPGYSPYIPNPDLFIHYSEYWPPKPALVDAIQTNRPGQYLSGFEYPKRGLERVGEPRYSGAKYSGGNGGENWGLDAPSEHLANARSEFGSGIDPTTTRSIAGGRPGFRRFGFAPAPVIEPSESVAPYARLLRSLLSGLAPTRPLGAPQGQTANGRGPDNVTLTRMIRQMQKDGASADEVRQMISEYRLRAVGAQR